MRLPTDRSPWDLALGGICLAVGLSPRLPGGLATAVAPLAGAILLVVTFLWYRRRQMHGEGEEFARLRTASLAVQVLWLAVLYDLTAGLLPLAGVLDRTLSGLLVATGACALAVAVMVALDLSVHRMARRTWLVAAGTASVAGVSRAGGAVWGVLSLSGLILGLVAPMGWLITLERRQRNLVLAGGFLSLIPLGATAAVFSLQPLSPGMFLTSFIRFGALFCLTYDIMLLVRAAQAISGASLYERKVEELDAVYDFGLTAATALDPGEFHLAVLHSLQRIGQPDVAAVVEPDSHGEEAVLSVLRTGDDGEHVYRHRTRTAWGEIADEFDDRRPLVVDDHRRSPAVVAPLRRIWQPASGSSVSVPVLSAEGRPRALLIAGRHRQSGFSDAEIHSLSGFGSQVGLAMEHARLLTELVEAERRKRELEIARTMQRDLLPRQPPALDRLDIADRSVPASEVGGDYFDYLQLGNDHLGVVVGDVSGHGMSAGLIMAMAKSAIHTHIRADSRPGLLLPRLGEMLLEMSAPNQYMTMVFALLDPASRRLHYINAGHHFPLHYRLAERRVERLASTGPPLGLLDAPPGKPRGRQLQPGDVLAFYSDGLVEAFNADDEEYGVERLEAFLIDRAHQSATRIVDEAFRAVRHFTGTREWHDDATLVVVRVLPD